ncbi:DUF4202 domain-containing protein [Colwellia sp. 6M3]|jgi:hypothetical protein|uniref:DUF4202 domain-containing protein n=1 Tax=Colwellia sp. 6M3 TaxID=2759849 RepID=UPI0015F742D3|nr:DUF4202 domain-containing protein [Colwellia sp. 6M3]MBA6416332.1 DUF4202 domain-containing protein [Colwellia sp. 6M3]|tara:strand:- start:1311 stop:1889 length:579 start_codon:yes stop_codon:yes gene_type:complete
MTQLENVLLAIDNINSADTNTTLVDGISHPKELLYGQYMSACLDKYWPNASEHLQIAVRAQHVKRWHLKRTDFAIGKKGYLTWRKELGIFHAATAKSLMLEQGYSEQASDITAAIIRKENLKSNSESQTLEDVACLVFLQFYFDEFAAKHNEEKIIRIVQLTWRKMSAQGQEIALTLSLPPHLATLVGKALA